MLSSVNLSLIRFEIVPETIKKRRQKRDHELGRKKFLMKKISFNNRTVVYFNPSKISLSLKNIKYKFLQKISLIIYDFFF